jgi:hypothetical protein
MVIDVEVVRVKIGFEMGFVQRITDFTKRKIG